jgi:hypothetical protein
VKATIIRPDGSWLYVEGTPEEIRALTPAPARCPIMGQPTTAICTCYSAVGQWCPVHGFPQIWNRPDVIYGVQMNACVGNTLPFYRD